MPALHPFRAHASAITFVLHGSGRRRAFPPRQNLHLRSSDIQISAACSTVFAIPRWPALPPAAPLVSFLTAWRRFLHLPGSDRATVLQAAVCLSATWLGLRLLGFRRWKILLDRLLSSSKHSAATDPALLPQALLLCRRGIAAELRFGARKQAARLEAHAWVACLGVSLNEDLGEHRHFLPFDGVNPLMETLPD